MLPYSVQNDIWTSFYKLFYIDVLCKIESSSTITDRNKKLSQDINSLKQQISWNNLEERLKFSLVTQNSIKWSLLPNRVELHNYKFCQFTACYCWKTVDCFNLCEAIEERLCARIRVANCTTFQMCFLETYYKIMLYFHWSRWSKSKSTFRKMATQLFKTK